MTHPERTTGFTMVELLVVMAIMAIVSGAVTLSLGPALQDARLRSGSRMVLGALNFARSHAVTSRNCTRVIFDMERNGIEVEELINDSEGSATIKPVNTPSGRFRRLPEGIRIERLRKPDGVNDESWISFTELGQGENALVDIADSHGRRRVIAVESITGRSRIEKAEDADAAGRE